MIKYSNELKENLNRDIKENFPHLFKVTNEMEKSFESVARLVMLDRYSQKDISLKTLKKGDLVITIVRPDPKFPARGIGYVDHIEKDRVYVKLEEDYLGVAVEVTDGLVCKTFREIDKPLEIYFEQIAQRVANNLGSGEKKNYIDDFYHELKELNIIPAGRVLFGAGSNANVTYFNCFVMPFIHDSRTGISKHREQVMEIMSRGGGVGTNGSTLRPKNALARGVNGKSSGAVSWLDDLSSLTHLVEQGGSRRGAQMIMMASWHPDIVEFIISKMQNPNILRFLIDNIKNEEIVKQAKNKIKFVPLNATEVEIYENILKVHQFNPTLYSKKVIDEAEKMLYDQGKYEVNNSEFLTGANISVAITNDFMDAVKNDLDYDLKFPDVDNYNAEEKKAYDELWQACGDVRKWEEMGYRSKVHRTIKAKDLWNLINICATYSAEPGIFFLDNANEMTNAVCYDQQVVCTNPCGEQPLAPYSVCNLAAINLANMVNLDTQTVNYEKFGHSIRTAVRMQDNVIDRTTYFLKENEIQALGERRVGLGVMGLHDLLIWCGKRYGSEEGNKLVDELFKFMAITAYQTSVDLAKEKGKFPFLKDQTNIDKLLNSGFVKKLPEDLRTQIKRHGLRNSHLLTIAPTGSTGTMVGVSTGLEPYFAFKYYRSGRLGKFMEVNAEIVTQFIQRYPETDPNNLPDIFVSAMELKPEEHADVQCIIQNWVDSSISKTVNAPKGYTVEDVEHLYMRLYDGKAKGGTVYVDGSRDTQVLTLKKDDNTPKQVSVEDFGIKVEEKKTQNKEENHFDLRADRQDREVGVEEGNICPICMEGTVKEIGGCNTCTNCNAQLKCGL